MRVRSTIYEASLALDECRWEDWLALCDDEFYYAIKAFSPEIRYDMTYLDGSRAELASMCEMLPKHNTDRSPLSRHTVVYRVTAGEDGASASAVSSFAVYRTILDGMASHVEAGVVEPLPGRQVPRPVQARERKPEVRGAHRAARYTPPRQGLALADLNPMRRRPADA